MAKPKSRARLKRQSTQGRVQRTGGKGQKAKGKSQTTEGKGQKGKGEVQRANSQMWKLRTTSVLSKPGCLMTHNWSHAPHYNLLMNVLKNLLMHLLMHLLTEPTS